MIYNLYAKVLSEFLCMCVYMLMEINPRVSYVLVFPSTAELHILLFLVGQFKACYLLKFLFVFWLYHQFVRFYFYLFLLFLYFKILLLAEDKLGWKNWTKYIASKESYQEGYRYLDKETQDHIFVHYFINFILKWQWFMYVFIVPWPQLKSTLY